MAKTKPKTPKTPKISFNFGANRKPRKRKPAGGGS
jgi:hypothetical protein